MVLTNDQVHECKRMLTERQSRLIQQLENTFGLNLSEKDSVGELSTVDNHPADLGTEMFERGKDLALFEHAEKELEDINKALYAIEEGTYGICRVCSLPIPFERLQAIPTADTCIEHATNNTENYSERPVEEEQIPLNLYLNHYFDEIDHGYDAENVWEEVNQYGSSDSPSDVL